MSAVTRMRRWKKEVREKIDFSDSSECESEPCLWNSCCDVMNFIFVLWLYNAILELYFCCIFLTLHIWYVLLELLRQHMQRDCESSSVSGSNCSVMVGKLSMNRWLHCALWENKPNSDVTSCDSCATKLKWCQLKHLFRRQCLLWPEWGCERKKSVKRLTLVIQAHMSRNHVCEIAAVTYSNSYSCSK